MSGFSDAFESLLDAQENALGYRPTASLNGKDVDFLAGDTNLVEVPVTGGDAESGAFVGHVRLSDWTASGAAKFSSFGFRGMELQVLNFQQINDTVMITTGDPTEDEA